MDTGGSASPLPCHWRRSDGLTWLLTCPDVCTCSISTQSLMGPKSGELQAGLGHVGLPSTGRAQCGPPSSMLAGKPPLTNAAWASETVCIKPSTSAACPNPASAGIDGGNPAQSSRSAQGESPWKTSGSLSLPPTLTFCLMADRRDGISRWVKPRPAAG